MQTSNAKPGKAGAIIIGLIEIGISLVCALLAALILFMPFPATSGVSRPLPAAFFYLFAGVLFLTFAVGTFLGKRWARTLMLILSWFWLLMGFLSFAIILYMMPDLDKSMNAAGTLPPGTVQIMKIVMAVFFFLVFIVLPGIFVLFYGRQKAKANFEFWDPQTSWTDKCPTPVLAVSLCAGLGVLVMFPLMAFYHFVIPFFGTLLDGWAGALVCLVVSVMLIYVAWGAYHLKMSAWWIQFGAFLFWGVSTVMTFASHSLLEMDEKMGVPETTLDRIRTMPFLNDKTYWAVYTGIIFAVYLLYLLFIRKYFRKTSN